jgi:predicted AAA+ superfamily ATPase
MKYVQRPEYLEKLAKWQIDSDMIKIITGVRRCGKSVLLKLFQERLIETGVNPEQIFELELDMPNNKVFLDSDALYNHVLENLSPKKKNFVFLDEIQMVKNWQEAANGLRAEKNIDLYLTGSNAYMFSGELATLLGGRYVEIKMQPLSFKEYVEGQKGKDLNADFSPASIQSLYFKYITESGFPQTLKYSGDVDLIGDYLLDTVYRNTINKDVIQRFKLKDEIKLDNVVRYLFDNISNETSMFGIEKSLRANDANVSNDSINKYVDGLLDSYLIYKCERLDLKGKKILSSSPKYYVCDAGLRAAVLGRKLGDTGRVLENVVYLELLRRGYDVYVGKIGRKQEDGKFKEIEVDFVATKANGIKEYYQVAATLLDESILSREVRSLEAINDNYPKYLLTMDTGNSTDKGINQLNVLDWLLGQGFYDR